MRRIVLILLVTLPIIASAQRGVEIKVSGGMEFIGVDPWLNGGIVTGSLLYNINGVFAIGASYSTVIGNKYYIDANSNAFDTSLSEIALDAYLTFLRVGKIKLYGTAGLAQVSAKVNELVPDFINFDPYGTPTLELEQDAIGFGFGAGGVLNLGGGLYFNFFEYRLRTLGSEFLDMDKGFQGSVGPMHTVKAGISYVIGAK